MMNNDCDKDGHEIAQNKPICLHCGLDLKALIDGPPVGRPVVFREQFGTGHLTFTIYSGHPMKRRDSFAYGMEMDFSREVNKACRGVIADTLPL